MRQKKIRIMIRMFMAICISLGMVLLLYPWITSLVQEHQASSEIRVYEDTVSDLDAEETDGMLSAACVYNEKLLAAQVTLLDPFNGTGNISGHEEYLSLLDMGDGLMGYLEIPAISVYLPVRHGTDEETLRSGVGHLEGSSLPIGGLGTHAVLTGHTGLSTAKLFTDLIELTEGDLFYFHVLGHTLTYEVTQILVVEPQDTEALAIRRDEDLMTLVTCTPYGINSHRLYVTGTRITDSRADDVADSTCVLTEDEKDSENDAGVADGLPYDSLWMRSYRNALLAGVAVSIMIHLVITVIRRRYIRREEQNEAINKRTNSNDQEADRGHSNCGNVFPPDL